jgi:hypothetical protein
MIEDKLDKAQRIRLEALAQANAAATMLPTKSPGSIIAMAKRFEGYIYDGRTNG